METALGFACGNTMKYLCQPIEKMWFYIFGIQCVYIYIYTCDIIVYNYIYIYNIYAYV